jgi:hypothetical protein
MLLFVGTQVVLVSFCVLAVAIVIQIPLSATCRGAIREGIEELNLGGGRRG